MTQKYHGILYSGNFEIHYNLDKELYTKISKSFKKFYVIDLTSLTEFAKQASSLKNKFPKNFIFIKIKNLKELDKFFMNKRFICINALPIKIFKNYRLNFYLRKYNIFHILNLRVGGHNKEYKYKKTIYNKIKLFLLGDLKHYIWRLLSIIGLSYKIDALFLGQSKIKKNFEKGFSKKVDNFFKTNFFSQYKKIIEVNNRITDLYKSYKSKISEKYIVYLDSPLDHPERLTKGGSYSIQEERLFYKKLNIFLLKLSKTLNKKIIICLHPKGSSWKKNFSGLRCEKYKAHNFIAKASVVLGIRSGLIGDSVFFNKKIIIIKSHYLGNYYSMQALRMSHLYNLLHFDIDYIENFKINKKKLFLELSNRTKKYHYFLKKKYVMNKKINGCTQIVNFIKKQN
tara:strand:+ start:374 stop:1567 length:1194 start_codon:yes stop_codon:yes gene_type:complete